MEQTRTNAGTDKKQVNHSTVRKGLTDYGDGANTTHYLGNDDYKERTNLPDDNTEEANEMLSGKEAGGNLDMNDEDKLEKDDLRENL